MPNCVSLRIQVDNIRGLIGTLSLMIAGDSAIFQPLDPLGRGVDSIAQGNVEVGYPSVVGNVAIGGLLELVFVMLHAVI